MIFTISIGSADGKKFRNFAQGLTFEIMVSHANRQLGKMTDRYLLIRDDIQPSSWKRGGQLSGRRDQIHQKSSGGESFIVSLSLALGLSHSKYGERERHKRRVPIS